MLKGLRGILEKGLQIAAPIIGGSMFGAPGAALGSGIASLISGDKAKDALVKAAASGVLGYRGADQTSLIDRMTGGRISPEEFKVVTGTGTTGRGGTKRMQSLMNKLDTRNNNLFGQIFTPRGTNENPKPSFGMQAIATGLPAVLSYMAAKEDRAKSNVPDASEYMSAVDKFYGGQFERPPEERRIQNLNPTYAAAGGMMGQQPVNGLKSIEQPVQYSAMTGQGIMGMAKGGDVYPRRTGQISGPGTKTSDSIPAMLSDGEFVQRTDAVNGAGVMMGAKNAQQAREKGADFMYALQDKLAKMGKRVA